MKVTVVHKGVQRAILVGGPVHLLNVGADRLLDILQEGDRSGRGVSREFEHVFLGEEPDFRVWTIRFPCGGDIKYGFDVEAVTDAMGLKPHTFAA